MFGSHDVDADRQQRNDIVAELVAHRLAGQTRLLVGDDDFDPGTTLPLGSLTDPVI